MPVYVGSTGHRYSAMALLEGRVSERNVWGGQMSHILADSIVSTDHLQC